MKILIAFLPVFFTFQYSFSQVENVYSKQKQSSAPKYYQDFLNFASDQENKTRIDIFIQVPYNEIQFVKNPDGFSASFMVIVSVFDENRDKLLVEKSWREKIDIKDFEQTLSKSNFHLSLRSFHLEPSKYFIRTSVEDEDSKKTYSSENVYIVRDLSEDISMSDIMLVSRQTQLEGSSKLLPNVSRNIATQKDGIPVFYEIYSQSSKEVKLVYIVNDKDQKEVFSMSETKELDSGRTQIIYTLQEISLGLGNYTLDVRVMDNDKVLTNISKTFISRWQGIPASIQDLDKAVDQLVYIATPGEIGEIEDAKTPEEKVERYHEFWKKRDPTPNTEENEMRNEYYRRVDYANENFSHYVEGWRSDRGMVFIILGSPNNVDRHPFALESKPYEVWQYYELNRTFIFVDETGFGDYRLVTPMYGDDFRFRN
jgi:GWxTD domain-containing protein